MPSNILPTDGLAVFVKAECETCAMIAPLIAALAQSDLDISVITQDDPAFPPDVDAVHDGTLEHSFHADIEIVPTIIRFRDGVETGRTFGWHREEWHNLTGRTDLGADLPDSRPGCGSRTHDVGAYETLVARFGDTGIEAREVTLGEWDDEIEACFDRGWSDGLPVVPPTDARVLRMLSGTARAPDEVIGDVRRTCCPSRSRRSPSTR